MPHSATGDSRKDALWGCRPHGKAHFACGPHQRAHSACGRSPRVRFSVRDRAQNALFRRVRFSSPAQTWSHLTQRRILRRRPHVKAQSAPGTSQKTALCAGDATATRALGPEAHATGAVTPPPTHTGSRSLSEKAHFTKKCTLAADLGVC